MTEQNLKEKPLSKMRILICGKGGAGKSSVLTLMVNVLQDKGYKVLALDGDASNPEGLLRLMFGLGKEDAPWPLIDFFGGIETVTCPVDDPSPLTRLSDPTPLPEKKIDIYDEISPEYFIQREGVILFQAGKIEKYGQGCDGPIEKVVRDFMVKGEWVNLIDVKAGIEHFGRRIADNMDIILTILDPTFESISIANRVNSFCREMEMKNFWFILNKIESQEIESKMMQKLGELKAKVIGVVHCDREVIKAGLEGTLAKCEALGEVREIIEALERMIDYRTSVGEF